MLHILCNLIVLAGPRKIKENYNETIWHDHQIVGLLAAYLIT